MKMLFRVFILIILLFGILDAGDKKKILILHSYHQSNKWTDDIHKGIVSTLQEYSDNMELHVEYMNTKRRFSKEILDELATTYKKMYSNVNFDLIFVSDNNAFNFLKKHHSDIFNNSPTIFCGVNFLNPDDLKETKNITGINETANIDKNIDLIKSLHPDVENIYIVLDKTVTGQRVKEEALRTIEKRKDKDIKFEILDNVTLLELESKLYAPKLNSVILYGFFFKDKKDQNYEYYEVPKIIHQLTHTPFYGLWDFSLENGIIGGYLTSGYFQGVSAGKMGIKVFQGIPIRDIKPLYQSPNEYMFDYEKLIHYNINIEDLPPNSYIINKQITFYEKYKKEIWLLIAIFLIMAVLILLLSINVRKRVKAEKAMLKQLRFQEALMENIEAAVFYKDKKGVYLGCNEGTKRLYGFESNEVIGKTVYDLFPKDIADKNHKEDMEIIKTQISRRDLGQIEKDDGSILYYQLHRSVFYDEEGKVVGIIATSFDITELHLATTQLNALNKNLENEVSKRTVELKQSNEDLKRSFENLQKMQKHLISSEKMASLGGLVAGVAHEINTPVGIGLTGITHFLENTEKIKNLYEKGELSEEDFEEFINSSNELALLINTNLERTAHLVKSFKQISVDQTNEEEREFNLYEYINEILFSIINITKKSHVAIQVECDKNLNISSYPGALSQILTNFIINSIKHGYNKDDRGVILIKAEKLDDNITLTYKDDGKGIPKSNLEKIFDPFFTTNRQEGGTGLGLNIVYNIVVNTLKGTIVCNSTLGDGVEFIINFKVKEG